MTLEEILPELRKGKPIWRKSWFTPWSKLQDNIRLVYLAPNRGEPYLTRLFGRNILDNMDILADDWEVFIIEQ